MADDARTLPAAQPRGRAITVEIDGEPLRAHEGEPLAVALWAAGVRILARSPKYHRPRGLFCASGHCASCLLRVDGKPNVRACMAPALDGLRAERQNAFPDVDLDVLAAADWLFPKGMDHHRLMTGTRLGNELFVKLVRQMGGTGTLPDHAAEGLPAARDERVDVCVVGAGPAGLAAARVIGSARPHARVLVVDDQDAPGGSLLGEPDGVARGRRLQQAAESAGARVLLNATSLAHYPEDRPASTGWDGPPGLLAVATPSGLVRVAARRLLYATGAYDQNLLFADNDRPGVLAARAVGRLAFRYGVRPGRRVLVLYAGALPAHAARLVRGLEACGIPTVAVELGQALRAALDEDVIAVAAVPAPASELPRQHGAPVVLDPAAGGFAVQGAPEAPCAPAVFAAGDVRGYRGPDVAEAEGALVGAAVAAGL